MGQELGARVLGQGLWARVLERGFRVRILGTKVYGSVGLVNYNDKSITKTPFSKAALWLIVN